MFDDDPADEGSKSPEKGGEPEGLNGFAPESPISPTEPGALDAFQRRARLAEDRLGEVLAAYRQVKTENEGFRERITRNLERRFDQRRERLLLKFIEILDNLDRALEATEQTYTGTPMIEGIILVRTQLLTTLKDEGLERIPVLGLPYDPAVAEAVESRPVAEPEHNQVVVKELLRGYRLNGRVARASRVVVGEYRGKGDVPKGSETDLVGADEVDLAAARVAEPPAEERAPRAERPSAASDAPENGASPARVSPLEEPSEPGFSDGAPPKPSAIEPLDAMGVDAAFQELMNGPEEAGLGEDPPGPGEPRKEIDLLKEVLEDEEFK